MEVVMWVGLIVFAAMALFGSRRARAQRLRDDAQRRALLVEEGDLSAWAARAGLEEVEVGERAWRGRSRRDPSEVSVTLDMTSLGQLVPSHEHSMVLTIDLGDGVPKELVVWGGKWRPNGRLPAEMFHHAYYVERGRADELFEHMAPEPTAFASSASPIFEALCDVHEALGLGSCAVSLQNGWLVCTVSDLSFMVEDRRQRGMRRALDALHGLRAALDALPEDAESQWLARILRRDSETPERRWEAARLLFEYEANSARALALARDFDALDSFTRAACARWGAEALGLSPRRRAIALATLLGGHDTFGEDIRALFVREYPWHTMLSAHIDTYLRVDAVPHALAAPDAPTDAFERDQDLVFMFTTASAKARMTLGMILDDLVGQGWEPSPQATLMLAKEGDGVTREALVRHIQARGVRVEDAPTVVELEGWVVPGARALLDELEMGAHAGNLSLAEDDGPRGALSQAASRGTLTPHEPAAED